MGIETIIKKIFEYFNTQYMQFVMNISVVQEKQSFHILVFTVKYCVIKSKEKIIASHLFSIWNC